MKEYMQFAVVKTCQLLTIDSPTGFAGKAAEWVRKEFEDLGFDAKITEKGGVLVTLADIASGINASEPAAENLSPKTSAKAAKAKKPADPEGGLLLEAHTDTLGGMVAEVKTNGRLRLTNLGGLRAENGEAENVRVYTRDGKIYEGTFQLCNASVHVNTKYADTQRTFDTCEVVLDEDVKTKADTEKLGIQTGDIVAFEPRTRVTKSGYIKSRFLDDKLSVGILLGLAKYIKDKDVKLNRSVYAHVTVYEEVGHGGSASVPVGITEAISVDMGCVGDGLACTERQVSICTKDSGGPYSYEVITKLIDAAKKEKADYALDVYPAYGSDVEATLRSGNDLRHGLIGAGVYASHGYERSHLDGVLATLKVLKGYLNI